MTNMQSETPIWELMYDALKFANVQHLSNLQEQMTSSTFYVQQF